MVARWGGMAEATITIGGGPVKNRREKRDRRAPLIV